MHINHNNTFYKTLFIYNCPHLSPAKVPLNLSVIIYHLESSRVTYSHQCVTYNQLKSLSVSKSHLQSLRDT